MFDCEGILWQPNEYRQPHSATAAGVAVSIEEGDGRIHVWHLSADRLPEARAAIERIGVFVRSHTP